MILESLVAKADWSIDVFSPRQSGSLHALKEKLTLVGGFEKRIYYES
jgi:hypothetical protein